MAEELMTTIEVMEYIGYRNLRGVAVWCNRRGIHPVSRQPGRKGENLYLRSQVEEWRRPGRGENVVRWNK